MKVGIKSTIRREPVQISQITVDSTLNQADSNRFSKAWQDLCRKVSKLTAQQKATTLIIGLLSLIIVALIIVMALFCAKPTCALVQDMHFLPKRNRITVDGINLDFQGYFIFAKPTTGYKWVLPLELVGLRQMRPINPITTIIIRLNCAEIQYTNQTSSQYEMLIEFAEPYEGIQRCLISSRDLFQVQSCYNIYTHEIIGELRLIQFDLNFSI